MFIDLTKSEKIKKIVDYELDATQNNVYFTGENKGHCPFPEIYKAWRLKKKNLQLTCLQFYIFTIFLQFLKGIGFWVLTSQTYRIGRI